MTNTNPTNPTRSRRIGGKVLTLVAMVVAAIGLSSVAVPSAAASPWDPHVAVTGRATCSPMIGSTPSWMWYSASNGEQGWATLSGSGITKSYRLDLWKVGTGGTTLTIKYGCSGISGESVNTFGVNRPAFGTYVTRNLCPKWWTGACWI